MKVMKCSVCGKPIVGYWVIIKKQGEDMTICVPCAQTTSVWDLVVEGVFSIQPDIAVEMEGVRADVDKHVEDSVSDYVKKKQVINSVYGTVCAPTDIDASKLDPDKNLPETVDFMDTEAHE